MSNEHRRERDRARRAEMRRHIALLRQRQSEQAANSFPEIRKYLKSFEFRRWYHDVTGEAWDESLEAMPELAIAHIESVRQNKRTMGTP